MCRKMLLISLLMMVMISVSGCVEVAWNSSGHIATQAPELVVDRQNKRYAWEYADPISSQEVVNSGQRNQPQIPQVVVIPVPANGSTVPANYQNYQNFDKTYHNKGTALISFGSLSSGGK